MSEITKLLTTVVTVFEESCNCFLDYKDYSKMQLFTEHGMNILEVRESEDCGQKGTLSE